MKLALPPSLSAATICSSTTGPHIWLVHSSGVAKLTTVGLPAARASSSEISCSGQAGSRVQIFSRPAALFATGVATGLALLPTAAGRLVPGLLVGLQLEPAGRERPGRPAGVVHGHPDLGRAPLDQTVVGGGEAEGVEAGPDLELALGSEQGQLGGVGLEGLQRTGRGRPGRSARLVAAAGGGHGRQGEGAAAGPGEPQEFASGRQRSDVLDGGARGAAGGLVVGLEQAVQLLLEPLQAWLVREPLGRRGELLVALAAGAGAEDVSGRQADGDAELALHGSIPALSGWLEVSL